MADIYSGTELFNLFNLLSTIVSFFKEFFSFLTSNVWELISSLTLPEWLSILLDTLNIDAFLSQFTILGLLFSIGIVAILIVYFFIP